MEPRPTILLFEFEDECKEYIMAKPTTVSDSSTGWLKRIRISILPDPLVPRTDRERKRYPIRNLLLHFRPSTVPEKTLQFTLTWGLGGMAAALVMLQIGTGVLLKFVYEPTPVAAYASIQTLIHDAPFGLLIRNLHHWCSHLLVVVIFLHMLRVFFTGAFHPPRQFNWVIGLMLFSIVLVENFTGYLLPWDQLAFWAVTVSTGMLEYVPLIGYPLGELIRGGDAIGPQTLRIFFALHTAVMPVLLVGLMGFHFWRVRKAGGVVIPRKPDAPPVEKITRIPAIPHLFVRESAMAALLIAVALMVSIFIDAPLEDPANPGLSPNPTKAPWYFAGLQELLMYFHPTFAVCIIPLILGMALAAIPYLNYNSETEGVWFASRTGRKTALVAAATAFILTPILIMVNEWVKASGKFFPETYPFLINGILPFTLALSGIVAFYFIIKKRFSTSKNEIVQSFFIFMITGFVILTLTGVWFRGEGMKLIAPW
jgi:quinol-cytochrome oxidoreductase complex cytochrome b subunit